MDRIVSALSRSNRYDINGESRYNDNMGGKRSHKNKQGAKELSRRGRHAQYHDYDDEEHLNDSGGSQVRPGCFASVLKKGVAGGRSVVNRMVPLINRGDGRFPKKPMWCKMKIPRGSRLGADFIVESLKGYVDGPFHPICPRMIDDDFVFYLEDPDVAAAVHSANGRIQLAPGNYHKKLMVYNHKAPALLMPITSEEMDVVKSVLSKRFNSDSCHLDLREFEADTEFKSCGMIANLARPPFMWAICKIIGDNIPNLVSLDLSKNRLKFCDWLGNLVCRTKLLRRLNLAENQIGHLKELEKLKGWAELVDLDLEHNPLMGTIGSEKAYISGVHRLFPKVTRLDNVEIPAADISFGIEEAFPSANKDISLPPYKPGFYLSDQLRPILENFILEYFKLYDAPDPVKARQALFQAYDSDAQFTLVLENLDRRAKYEDSDAFHQYRRKSHNILNMDKWDKFRHHLICNGNLQIVSLITQLPRTEHIKESFILDVQFATDSMMCFTVTGLFRDADLIGSTDPTLARYFSKSFVVKSMGSNTLAIVNDMLLISALTPSQVEAYSRLLNKSIQDTSVQTPSTSALPDREALIGQFSAHSHMKKEWAAKCLEDNLWDLQAAINVFNQMKQQNIIPPQAFDN